MKKRFLSLALSLVLVISLFPKAALAEDYDYIDWASDFHEGLALVSNHNDKYGFIDKTGKEAIPLKYDLAGDFHEGLAWVRIGEKYGFIDKTGKQITKPQYAGAESFSGGLAMVYDKKTYGFIDKTGKLIIPFGKYGLANSFSDGIACVTITTKEPWKTGCVDKSGKAVIPFGMYNDLDVHFSEGLAKVSKNGAHGYINKIGKAITSYKYNNGGDLSDGMAKVQNKNSKWGFINKTGKEVVPLKYDYVTDFSEGTAVVSIGSKCGVIDKTGKLIIPLGKYDDIPFAFSEGLTAVVDDGKWGYIDKTGREVIPRKYASAGAFSEGVAVVGYGGIGGYIIDKTGREVGSSINYYVGEVHDGWEYISRYGDLYLLELGVTHEDSTMSALIPNAMLDF